MRLHMRLVEGGLIREEKHELAAIAYSAAFNIFRLRPEAEDLAIERIHELFDLTAKDFDFACGMVTYVKFSPATISPTRAVKEARARCGVVIIPWGIRVKNQQALYVAGVGT